MQKAHSYTMRYQASNPIFLEHYYMLLLYPHITTQYCI